MVVQPGPCSQAERPPTFTESLSPNPHPSPCSPSARSSSPAATKGLVPEVDERTSTAREVRGVRSYLSHRSYLSPLPFPPIPNRRSTIVAVRRVAFRGMQNIPCSPDRQSTALTWSPVSIFGYNWKLAPLVSLI